MRRFLPGPAALILIAVAFPIALSPLKTPDLFFHLAGGRWILQHGFSTHDPFSVTGTQWVLHEWGFGVVAELLVRIFGAAGPELLVSALVFAWGFLEWRALRRASGRGGLFELVLFGLTLDALSFTFPQERPYHVAHVLFAIALMRVQAWRDGNVRALWPLVPLGALWVNLHASWLLSPALISLAAAASWLESPSRASAGRAARALGIAGLTFLSAAVSPNGWRTFLYPLQHARLASTQNIVEWWPITLDVHWNWSFVLLLMLGCWTIGNAERRRLTLLLPAIVFAVAALRTMRHIPFAAMVVSIAVAEHGALARPLQLPEPVLEAWRRLEAGIRGWSARASGEGIVSVLLLIVAARAALHPLAPRDRINAPFQISVIEKLKELPPGKVLNKFHFGGPISYFAGPEYKVFIDSRNDPFPWEIHQQYQAMLNLDAGWREAVRAYDPDYLVWSEHEYGKPFLDALKQDGGWIEYFRDGAFVLWVRERNRVHP